MGSNARYHLWDVYFHLVYPHRAEVNYQPERIMPALESNLRVFVVNTAWEELVRVG